MTPVRKSTLVLGGVVLAGFIISACFYPLMPNRMASHWNSQGQVDGYISRIWGMLLMPLIVTGIALLFLVIPLIDPLKANIEKFRASYDGFVIILCVFLLCIHMQMILWNLGVKISPSVTVPIGLGFLFFYCGILCENSKRNWFVGIRTPWTLSNDKVWEKTHKLGGKLFRVTGIVIMVAALFPRYTCLFVIVSVIPVAVFLTVYSYLEYRTVAKEQRSNLTEAANGFD